MCCAVPATAHYEFGWAFSGPNGESSVHAVEGPGDGFTTVYNYDGTACHEIRSDGTNINNCAPPTYSSCDQFDIHDEPVRVFRFQGGDGPRLQMNLGVSTKNRRYIGTTLENLAREQQIGPTIDPDGDESRPCATNIVYKAPGGGPPWNFNQDEWVTSPYHVSGPNPAVYALMHVEFRGTKYCKPPAGKPIPEHCTADPIQDYCPTNVHHDCWMGSTTLAKSVPEDAGSTIVNALGAEYGSKTTPPPLNSTGFHGGKNSIVATLPQQYHPNPDSSNPSNPWGFLGYAAITNIIKKDGYYYYVGGTQGSPAGQPEDETQPGAVCVFRTDDLDDVTRWRAWNGQGFNTRYLSPYQGADPYPWSAALSPEQRREQICATVQTASSPLFPPRQLTYNENLKKYMLMGRIDGTGDNAGIYYSLSDDLINWTPRQVLLAAPKVREPDAQGNFKCEEEETLGYPVILDPDDAAWVADPSVANVNTNFDHPDRTAYLYASRRPCPNPTRGGDLVRTPIKFMQRSASLEPLPGPADAWDNNQGSYDGTVGAFTTTTSTSYDGTSASQATTAPGQPQAYGKFNVRWKNGDDVWYGGAYKLPTTFLNDNGSLRLMVWHAPGSRYGGVALDGSDQWRIIRGSPDAGGYLPGSFTLPFGRWFWLEVHQKLGTADGGDTLNEVFVDGQLVFSSQTRNKVGTDQIETMRFGFTHNDGPTASSLLHVDRASVAGGQLGALRGASAVGPAGQGQAPNAPTGLRKVFTTPTLVGLVWNAPEQPAGWDAPSGYRVYRKDGAGAWYVGPPITGSTGTYESIPVCSTPPPPSGDRTFTYRVTALRQLPGGTVESTVSMPLELTVSCTY